jgi:uncharacterized glyoxalase superfamily protein PhnB
MAMPSPRLLRVQLVLPVARMSEARDFYARALDFETTYLHDDPVEDPEGNYAILRRDPAELHLILDEPPHDHPWTKAGTGYVFLIVQDLDAIFAQVQERGVPITRPIIRESWGARAFQLTDPSGNLILVAEETS